MERPRVYMVRERKFRFRWLLHVVTKTNDNETYRMTACTYISGSICLMANTMFDPRHENVEDDRYLAEFCFSFLEGIIDQVPFEPLQRTRNACEELLRYTHAASLQSAVQDASCFRGM